MKFSRIVKIVVGLGLLAGVVILSVAYRTLNKATARRTYSIEKQAKIVAVREKLTTEQGAQKVNFTTEDGIALSGLFFERPNARRAVLICHGYGMSKEDMRRYANLFPNDTLLMFDFRAHGESQGNLVSIGHYEQRDVRAAVKFLRNHESVRHVPLIGLGVSMGAATLLGAAAHGVPFDALIIDSAFARLPDMIVHSFVHYTGMPKTVFMPLVVMMYNYVAGCSPDCVLPVDFIKNIHCPVLVIHSQDDATSPVANANALYAAAYDGRKELWVVQKSKHAFIIHDYPEEYAARVHQFLATVR